jgi:hypothetical protein
MLNALVSERLTYMIFNVLHHVLCPITHLYRGGGFRKSRLVSPHHRGSYTYLTPSRADRYDKKSATDTKKTQADTAKRKLNSGYISFE